MSSYEVSRLIRQLEDGKSEMDYRYMYYDDNDRESRFEREKNAYNALADALIFLLERSDSN